MTGSVVAQFRNADELPPFARCDVLVCRLGASLLTDPRELGTPASLDALLPEGA